MILLVILAFGLAACAPQELVGDPDQGARLFYADQIGEGPGCKSCHSVAPGQVIVGPSLAGVGEQAETRVPGLEADEYIRQSILEPNAYVVEGFTAGTMYQDFAHQLNDEDLRNLVAFLMQLENVPSSQ
jgi:cytochrome c2